MQFLTYCKDVKKNSPSWLYQQRRYVAWWAKQLQGVSLARATLREQIIPALKDQTARAHRIATIKALYAWLRKIENLLTPADDPTLDTLMVPQAKPGLRAMKNKTIPADHHHQARAHLDGHWAAGMDVQAGSGWHITEVKRFAERGAIEAHPNGAVGGVAGVLVCPEAKGGGELRTPVSSSVLEAAKLLLARGSFDVARYRNAVKAACVAAGVPVFTPGRFRHTVGTAAINSGANAAQVSAFLNHKDPRTLKRFYATHAVVQKIPTLL